MQGILKTPGPTVAGNLEHGRVKVVPSDTECKNPAAYDLQQNPIPIPLKVDGSEKGASLTCPCTRCPATVRPGVSSSPCISGPKGTTSPVTSGSNSHVDLFQVYPL